MTSKEKFADQISLIKHLSKVCRETSSTAQTIEHRQEMHALGVYLEMIGEWLEEIYDSLK